MVGTGNTNQIHQGSDSQGAVRKSGKHNTANMIVLVCGVAYVLCNIPHVQRACGYST